MWEAFTDKNRASAQGHVKAGAQHSHLDRCARKGFTHTDDCVQTPYIYIHTHLTAFVKLR